MTFNRELLPDPTAYFEAQGINTGTGAWVCMACGEKGGDVLAYEMAITGAEFVDAAKAIGAWIDDGKPHAPQKPAPLPPRAALSVLAFESTLVAVAAGNVAHGVKLSDADRFRLLTAAGRVNRIAEAYQ